MTEPTADIKRRNSLFSTVTKVIPGLVVACLMAAGWLAIHQLNIDAHDEIDAGGTIFQEDASANLVKLPPGKVKAAEFRCEPVEHRDIQHVHVVPGRIRYDESKHVSVKTPSDGILSEVLVQPGDQVEVGQTLAVVSSPEIGQARAEVLRRESALQLAERALDRAKDISSNLDELLSTLDSHPNTIDIEAQFANVSLGEYREQLQQSFSKFRLAADLMENVRPLSGTGSLPERTIRERESELQIARGAYFAARELSAFQAKQNLLEATAAYDNADRLTRVARQQLKSLLGYEEIRTEMDTDQQLSRLEIHAPMSGTIELRSAARNERLNRNDEIFVLADTSSLYVEADVRENDWPAIELDAGAILSLTIPAIPNREFSAAVHYVGREVDPSTNAVPVIATIDNQDRLLRPGLFVRVALPVGRPAKGLAVPAESVLQHDDQQFVFVCVEDDTFQRVDVALGVESEKWVEVKGGLSPGQAVVRQGAFLLKSELLLEGEGE